MTITSDDLPPDLIVYALSIPANVAAGSIIPVQDTTKNQGAGSAPDVEDGVLSVAEHAPGMRRDQYLGERTVSALPFGAVETATTQIETARDHDARHLLRDCEG